MIAADACFARFDASHALILFDVEQKYADIMFVDEIGTALTSSAADGTGA